MRITTSVLAIVMMSFSGAELATAQPAPSGLPSGQGDHVVFVGDNLLHETALPRGPLLSSTPVSEGLAALAFSPAGQLFAVRRQPDSGIVELVQVSEDGDLVTIGEIQFTFNEAPRDLAFDRDGNLFLLTSWYYWNPPESGTRLLELDVATGAVLDTKDLWPEIAALAPAPQGLWAVGYERLYRLYPSTGTLIDSEVLTPAGFVSLGADTDSTGAIWLVTEASNVSPPLHELRRLDPASGIAPAPAPIDSANLASGPLAIRRQCQESATARCLQGGRFRAEVSWQTPDQTGNGRTARSHSADSALFWFFSPANWEFLVKVLDGCDENGHFWVLTAAATDVAYTLWVTDLESGLIQTYEHAGGLAATAVTDIYAFATCP